jgi:hypothetical protein
MLRAPRQSSWRWLFASPCSCLIRTALTNPCPSNSSCALPLACHGQMSHANTSRRHKRGECAGVGDKNFSISVSADEDIARLSVDGRYPSMHLLQMSPNPPCCLILRSSTAFEMKNNTRPYRRTQNGLRGVLTCAFVPLLVASLCTILGRVPLCRAMAERDPPAFLITQILFAPLSLCCWPFVPCCRSALAQRSSLGSDKPFPRPPPRLPSWQHARELALENPLMAPTSEEDWRA